MTNPEGLILVAPFAWGLYKCAMLARRPTTNKKAVLALAAMLGVWVVVLTIAAISSAAAWDARLVVAGTFLFAGVAIAASILAILGLREIRRAKRTAGDSSQTKLVQGTWPAVGALVLASALLVPSALYAGAHFFEKRARQVTRVASANWTSFTSPEGDFEVQFPGVPEATAVDRAASDGRAIPRAFTVTHGRAMYGVTVREDPTASVTGAEKAFDLWEKGITDRFPGRVTDRLSDVSGGVATREVRGLSPEKATAYRFRAIVVDRHMYVLAAIMLGPTDQGQVADQFFRSFKLRSAKATPPGPR
jgi:hypothetical protein